MGLLDLDFSAYQMGFRNEQSWKDQVKLSFVKTLRSFDQQHSASQYNKQEERKEKKKLQSQFHAPDTDGTEKGPLLRNASTEVVVVAGQQMAQKSVPISPFFWDVCFRTDHPPSPSFPSRGRNFPPFLHPISLYEKVLRRAGAGNTWAQQTQGNLINGACSIFPPCVFCGKTNLPCKRFYVAHPRLFCMREILRLCLRGRA